MADHLLTRARMTVSGTPGAGDVTLGAAAAKHITFATAGAVAGRAYRCFFQDGAAWEESWARYSTTGPSLTGRTLIRSSTGSLLSLTSAAEVFTGFDKNDAPNAGEVIAYAGHTPPAGYFPCDGRNVSRSANPALLDALIKTATVTISNASPAVITWAAHLLPPGSKIRFTTTGGLPTGLALATDYFIITAGYAAGSFRLSASIEGAAINTSSAGSGVHTAINAQHGIGDGSTTLGVPDYRGRSLAGLDNEGDISAGAAPSAAGRLTGIAGSVDGRSLGAVGGEEAHSQGPGEVASHSHSVLSRATATAFGANARATEGNTAGTTTNDILTNLTGNGDPANVVNPTAIVHYAIYAG